MAQAIIMPKKYFFDKDGNPLAYGKVYTYQAGTTIDKETFTTENGDVANTNPIILNGEGYASIYLNGSYKIVVDDQDDNNIWTEDHVSSNTNDEWVSCESVSYVSVTSFKIQGNATNKYEPQRRVRIDNNIASFSYSTILTSSFSGGETTVAIVDSVIQPGVIGACISITGPESSFNKEDAGGLSGYTFKNIADMKAGVTVGGETVDLSLAELDGVKVSWMGYYEQSDGGSNWGRIQTGTHTDDGGSIITISGNTHIEANLKGNSINALKFGVKVQDNTFDSLPALNNLNAYAKGASTQFRRTIKLPSGALAISDTFTLIRELTYQGMGAKVSIFYPHGDWDNVDPKYVLEDELLDAPNNTPDNNFFGIRKDFGVRNDSAVSNIGCMWARPGGGSEYSNLFLADAFGENTLLVAGDGVGASVAATFNNIWLATTGANPGTGASNSRAKNGLSCDNCFSVTFKNLICDYQSNTTDYIDPTNDTDGFGIKLNNSQVVFINPNMEGNSKPFYVSSAQHSAIYGGSIYRQGLGAQTPNTDPDFIFRAASVAATFNNIWLATTGANPGTGASNSRAKNGLSCDNCFSVTFKNLICDYQSNTTDYIDPTNDTDGFGIKLNNSQVVFINPNMEGNSKPFYVSSAQHSAIYGGSIYRQGLGAQTPNTDPDFIFRAASENSMPSMLNIFASLGYGESNGGGVATAIGQNAPYLIKTSADLATVNGGGFSYFNVNSLNIRSLDSVDIIATPLELEVGTGAIFKSPISRTYRSVYRNEHSEVYGVGSGNVVIPLAGYGRLMITATRNDSSNSNRGQVIDALYAGDLVADGLVSVTNQIDQGNGAFDVITGLTIVDDGSGGSALNVAYTAPSFPFLLNVIFEGRISKNIDK